MRYTRLSQIVLYMGVTLALLLFGLSCQQPSSFQGFKTAVQDTDKTSIRAENHQIPADDDVFEESQDNIQIVKLNDEPEEKHSISVLSVPFFPQAPHANWDMPYQEACEEASMLMVAEYYMGNQQSEILAAAADQKILELISWEQNNGFSIDLTAKEVIAVLGQRFNLAAEVFPYDPEVIKQAITKKQLVIVPVAGRLLGNPYFRQPGPLYHMLVIKGYELNEFITNDPGTRRGLSYRYQESILARAVHDWNGGDVENGDQVIIIVSN